MTHPRELDLLRRRLSSTSTFRRSSSLHNPSVSFAPSPWYFCNRCRSL
jgi:hypothetical protein